MEFGKTIKRIAAIGLGATMLMGSTMAAADLSNYPSMYFTGGKFNGILVIGDKADTKDVIGVTDIAISLQYSATSPAGSSGTDVTVEGEAWKVGTSTNKLEMSENLETGQTANRESISDIANTYITDSELPNTLADGTISNAKGEATYNQRLYFEDTATGYVVYAENDNDVTADFLYFQSGKQIARYEMEFTTQLQSDVDDSAGSATATGTYLTDMEDAEISMLGKIFTIVQARRLTSAGNNLKLVLMGGSVKDTLLEGDTKTYTVQGKDYEITLDFVSSTQAKFTVNGEASRLLRDGETDKLSDGTEIGVSEILYQDYAGGVHSSTFFIGAAKMELKDSSIRDSVTSYELKVGDTTIDGANVILEGTDDNSTFKLERIKVNMSADDDYYVPAGAKLSENEDLAEPELLFTNNWDIQYLGLSTPETHDIKVKPSGSTKYQLEFYDGSNDKTTMPLIYTPSGSLIKVGDDDNSLVLSEGQVIRKDDYFFLVNGNDADGERSSFGMRYRGSDKSTADSPVIKFDNLGSGERIERPLSVGTTSVSINGDDTTVQVGELKLGGATFKIYNASTPTADNMNVYIDYNADGSVTNGTVAGINDYFGAKINLTNASASYFTVDVDTINTNQYDNKAPTAIKFNLSAASAEVTMSLDTLDVHNWKTPEGEDNIQYAFTAQGAKAKLETPTSDPGTMTITYPKEQRLPLVYVTGQGTTTSTSTSAEGAAVTVNRIEVGATKLASDVADITAQNAILVGGPCANAAAAEVMGNPADCTAGFKAGSGLIQLFENNGKVAMLVAGYSAEDTTAATSVVANSKNYKLKGTKMEVTTATATVKEAVAVEETPAEEEAETTEE